VDRSKRRFFGYAFGPGTKLFQISISLKDNPGALADALQVLRNRVDWIGSVGYSKGEGKAIWSGFAKALRPEETPNSLKSLLASTGMIEDSWITSSDDGLLVDAFHTGVEDEAGEEYMLVPMKDMSETYERLIEILGSGGESILYDEGVSAGKVSAQYFIEKLGIGFVREKMSQILLLFGSMGWGNAEMKEEGYGAEFTVRIADCFECSAGRRARQYCSFQRGHLAGLISSIYDTPLECSETRCRFRRDPFCEFKLTQKQGPRMEA
jgi:predicted hydrocarbon binding protein